MPFIKLEHYLTCHRLSGLEPSSASWNEAESQNGKSDLHQPRYQTKGAVR